MTVTTEGERIDAAEKADWWLSVRDPGLQRLKVEAAARRMLARSHVTLFGQAFDLSDPGRFELAVGWCADVVTAVQAEL
jgi:hypothetical protein